MVSQPSSCSITENKSSLEGPETSNSCFSGSPRERNSPSSPSLPKNFHLLNQTATSTSSSGEIWAALRPPSSPSYPKRTITIVNFRLILVYYQVKASTSTESVEIFRPFGKSISSDKIDSGIRNWIGLFDRPFVYPFDDRASGEIFSDKRNAVFFFLPEGEVGEKARMELFALAFDWKIQLKRRLIFTELRVYLWP